jgi:hypothetical protein
LYRSALTPRLHSCAWLQCNIDRLSLTFGRRVIGVHNPTDGIIFDLVQCLVQRNFCYSTEDIRAAYVKIKDALMEPHINKVVFILHSQGGIEGGLIIDWLLDELPQDKCQKLEVYTFGNAANHFNNPVRSGISHGGYEPHQHKHHHKNAIRHIEHYANQGDFVSQFGVLNYTSLQNRFMGRVFVSPSSGHLLNQHYLHAMFPLDPNTRTCLDSNAFMEMDVYIGVDDLKVEGREGVRKSLTVKDEKDRVAFVGDANSPVSPIKRTWSLMGDPEHGIPGRPLKVKDFSRLWQYRNGQVPDENDEVPGPVLNGIVEEPGTLEGS